MHSKGYTGLAALGIGALVCANSAWGGPVLDPNGSISEVRAGVFCAYPADAQVDAPDTTGGDLEVYIDPFGFVLTGDTVAAQPGIGIGVVAKMGKFRAGEYLRVRVHPPTTPSEEWDAAPDSNGRVWFGYLGDEHASFPAGDWKFELLRGRAVLMTYDFVVMKAGTKGIEGFYVDCTKPVS
jgi:hypothetical protein